MTTRMLIDARHREETRVAVVKGNRIEEFDFESAERKQLKGNIYLAKVTRVEPSLQAAFIDYGGNRHGFLAFSEIHPDYYQIPKEDRDALLREEAEHAAEEAALRAQQDAEDDLEADDEGFEPDEESIERYDDDGGHEADEIVPDREVASEGENPGEGRGRRRRKRSASDDAADDLRERRTNLRHRYKIQDVIRRRQVLLVQVVKEERGNKGAALTTYLSLAGRYCVLMPNTSHGGGISRKISNAGDRKRLKSIMADMKLPPSMGCIVRTAGLQRTRQEIKRDFDYLARLWDGIREATLSSSAPALVYGDSDLMKRAIRDIYNREIDEVIVEGTEGYQHAKDFMRLLMPSHARKVKHYSDPVPLFQRAGVEEQLSAMYHPVVQLKSGGYLVINPTEALVSIDINSGRSTREHSIEQTATATNLEAAAEIARQLRLRDMAGLVVIDFIDMDNGSNVRKVEKAMKEALKNDRARIQIGRISSFGLMEMSRQRLRTGVLEASTRPCPHCEGSGFVRTASSSGLSALRLLEDEAAQGRGSQLLLRASQEAAFYLLNRKRAELAEIEERYGVMIEVSPDGEQEGARMSVEVSGPPPAYTPRFDAPIEEIEEDIPEEEFEEEVDDFVEEEEEPKAAREPRERPERAERAGDDEGGSRRRRRRRGRRGRNRPEGEGEVEGTSEGDIDGEMLADTDEDRGGAIAEASDVAELLGADVAVESDGDDTGASAEGDAAAGEGGKRRRGRRGRRGGRRAEGEQTSADQAGVEPSTDEAVGEAQPVEAAVELPAVDVETMVALTEADAPVEAVVEEEAPKKGRRRPKARKPETDVKPAAKVAAVEAPVAETPAVEAPAVDAEADAKPKRRRTKKAAVAEAPADAVVEAPVAPVAEEAPAKPKRARRPKAKADGAVEAPVADTSPAIDPVVAVESTPAIEPAPDASPVVEPTSEREAPAPAPTAIDPDPGEAGTPRRGWWQRTFGA
ncbi:ribonuclease E/G [Sphingomonas sp. CARO-RG-8B-R24-01]|uniref:Rne/Rng family ribonuclease n=1 Tax=Sphingomonas sp. CARO-RG-8B-R24-01 TaxID=2914831 RepID=UPI001F5A0903|nr:ribonuclease E/G [Sphingomonas sp. CARO-RG-8B-R24-01]